MKGLAEIRRDNVRERLAAKGEKQQREQTITIKVQVSPQVAGALDELLATGFFGNGQDVESVAEELLRRAVRDEIERHR